MTEDVSTPKMSPAGGGADKGPKRIYEIASAAPVEGGFAIQLDGRNVRTPARDQLIVPRRAMADAIIEEWMTQGVHIDAQTMPITKFANTAIDNVRGREDAVIDDIAAFAGNDLLCYRAETPDSLVGVQNDAWDPVLDWVETTFAARLVRVAGVIHAPQPEASLASLRTAIAEYDAFALTGLHNMTTLTGSALLALACAHRYAAPDDVWTRAHVDEDWQITQWGPDEEAAERRRYRGGEFAAAYRFLTLHND